MNLYYIFRPIYIRLYGSVNMTKERHLFDVHG